MPITALADDALHRGWDHDTGQPTVSHFGNAVQVWAIAQDRTVTVREAAKAFNVTPELIKQAIERDYSWMYLNGDEDGALADMTIEHDGE